MTRDGVTWRRHVMLSRDVCDVCSEQLELREREEQEHQRAAEHMEFPHRRRTMIVAGATVAAVMMTYALLTGLWKVKVVDNMVDQVVKVVKGQSDREASVEFRSQTHKWLGGISAVMTE